MNSLYWPTWPLTAVVCLATMPPDRRPGFLALAGRIVCAVAMAPEGRATFARGNADHVDGGGCGRGG
jgi:hypothetical protein